MTSYQDWAARHPQAATELRHVLAAVTHQPDPSPPDGSEARAQQQVRLSIAKQGGLAWRNNVGALKTTTRHTCPRCQFRFTAKQTPIRWGLCNDSAKLNTKVKSSDLIGIIPRLITPDMCGTTIGQFLAVETKMPGWNYSGNQREAAQLAWLTLIADRGGISAFSSGEIEL